MSTDVKRVASASTVRSASPVIVTELGLTILLSTVSNVVATILTELANGTYPCTKTLAWMVL